MLHLPGDEMTGEFLWTRFFVAESKRDVKLFLFGVVVPFDSPV